MSSQSNWSNLTQTIHYLLNAHEKIFACVTSYLDSELKLVLLHKIPLQEINYASDHECSPHGNIEYGYFTGEEDEGDVNENYYGSGADNDNYKFGSDSD
jgi:hypothetical protein